MAKRHQRYYVKASRRRSARAAAEDARDTQHLMKLGLDLVAGYDELISSLSNSNADSRLVDNMSRKLDEADARITELQQLARRAMSARASRRARASQRSARAAEISSFVREVNPEVARALEDNQAVKSATVEQTGSGRDYIKVVDIWGGEHDIVDTSDFRAFQQFSSRQYSARASRRSARAAADFVITVESHPRRDRTILNVLNQHGKAGFMGGVGGGGYRSIQFVPENSNMTTRQVETLLKKWVDAGVVEVDIF